MAVVQINSNQPSRVDWPGHAITVEFVNGNNTAATVYYKYDPSVSSVSNNGSLSAGQSVTLTGTAWFIPATAASGSTGFAVLDVIEGAPSIQGARVNVGALLASSTADVTVTWPIPFADTNYTVAAVCIENVSTGTNGAFVRQVRTKTTDNCVIRVSTGTQAFSSGQVLLEAVAIHD